VLTFYTPDFSAQGKIIYACVTYILLTLVYTFVNVPYCAMPGVITADPKERHALQSWRFSWRRRDRSPSAALPCRW
jgi:Na+/melibiose symporter-like transporter